MRRFSSRGVAAAAQAEADHIRWREQLMFMIRSPLLHRSWQVACGGVKGGSNKTTVAVCVSIAVSRLRADPVLLVDANPDGGTVEERLAIPEVVLPAGRLVDLVRRLESVTSRSDLMPCLGTSDRLQFVSGAATDQTALAAVSEQEYRQLLDTLSRFFAIIVSDLGSNLVGSIPRAALGSADHLLLSVRAEPGPFNQMAQAVRWLARSHPELVAGATVVVTANDPDVDVEPFVEAAEGFRQLCAHVAFVPFDAALRGGPPIAWEDLSQATQDAYLDVAASVAARFPTGAESASRFAGLERGLQPGGGQVAMVGGPVNGRGPAAGAESFGPGQL